jgi:hypothetical protein
MMSVPSISALTAGISFSAWQTALVKKPMKPSFTPCFFSNRSLYFLRMSMTGRHVHLVVGGQHGGRVLRILQAAGDGLAQRVMRTRSSRAASSADEAGPQPVRRAAGAEPLPMASSTSPLSTCPRLPEPATSPARLVFGHQLGAEGEAACPYPPPLACFGSLCRRSLGLRGLGFRRRRRCAPFALRHLCREAH